MLNRAGGLLGKELEVMGELLETVELLSSVGGAGRAEGVEGAGLAEVKRGKRSRC